jgi:hypothetical protein
MNPFDSSVFLSVMWKSSNALVTISDRICFEYGGRGHYEYKCPQRRLKNQLTETDIATTQLSSALIATESQVIGKQNVHRPQATQNATHTLAKRKCYNCAGRGHFANACSNPRSRPPLPPSTKTTPNDKKRFYVSQSDHVMFQLWTGWSFCQSMPRPTSTIDPNPRQLEYGMNSSLQEVLQLWTEGSLC